MGTPLGPKYIPDTYMDPLGLIRVINLLIKPLDPETQALDNLE